MTANLKDAWKTERLYFRSIRETDYDWFFNDIDSDPLNKALSNPSLLAPPRRQKPEEWYKMWEGPNRLLDLVICLRQTANPFNPEGPRKEGGDSPDKTQPEERRIGVLCVIYSGYGRSPHSGACELGITLVSSYQDRGFGTEAVKWALDWAFRRANMHSVNLSSVEYNKRAHRCYEKCGFKLEGRRRQCFWHERKWYDLFFYGILEDEWDELRSKEST
ncbi:hypothetical protein N0V82_007470 [Gnomoniopsis sp. IMI 355080]|nr:hypothetical protein N0V82_007470 [Gnomoniopsis sp. IMI 355080]